MATIPGGFFQPHVSPEAYSYILRNIPSNLRNKPFKEFDGTDNSRAQTFKGTSGNDYVILGNNDKLGSPSGSPKGYDVVEASKSIKLAGTGFRGALLTGDGNFSVTGASTDDSIIGNSGNNTVKAGAGDDVVSGGGGNDRLFGDSGNDTIFGDAGNDSLFGGSGNDLLKGGDGNDKLDGSSGKDKLYGGDGNDVLKGGSDNDTLLGDAGRDSLYGDAQNDLLKGGADNDRLFGGTGNDKLYGDDGDDYLDGMVGNDQLFGLPQGRLGRRHLQDPEERCGRSRYDCGLQPEGRRHRSLRHSGALDQDEGSAARERRQGQHHHHRQGRWHAVQAGRLRSQGHQVFLLRLLKHEPPHPETAPGLPDAGSSFAFRHPTLG
jgi:Ca2+-binding RTX toxin-like protein